MIFPYPQHSALIANGQIEDLSKLGLILQTFPRIVAVDRGLIYCNKLGIIPDLIVGDFDSVPEELLAEYDFVQKITLQSEKDETDLEIALEHELKSNKTVTLFGALGKRIDHSLTNLLIATRYPGRIYIETEEETVFALQGDVQISARKGQTLSLIPINGPVKEITTDGLQWELKNRTLDASFVGISNVCLQENVHIKIGEGILLCALLTN